MLLHLAGERLTDVSAGGRIPQPHRAILAGGGEQHPAIRGGVVDRGERVDKVGGGEFGGLPRGAVAIRARGQRHGLELYWPSYLGERPKSGPGSLASLKALGDRKNAGHYEEWTSPTDPDARITKMKDGRTVPADSSKPASCERWPS